jgi:nucleoside-diphosphate-sugar epimerase
MRTGKILILGGSGFVSGTLARLAAQRGDRVWAVTRGRRPLPAGVTALIADRKDTRAFAQAVAAAGTDWDMVVDCIGYEPEDARQDVAVFRSLTRHLVFISTDFVYDPAHRRFPQNEDTEHYLSDGYSGKKRQCELELMRGDCGDMAWTILRPCHIYGPGSLLGCLPLHARDAQLLARLQKGEPLQLVGGGRFLQQPILASDLAETILNLRGNAAANGQVFCVAGPDVVESRQYYQIIANHLNTPLRVIEAPVSVYQTERPEHASFLCHRFYDLSKLAAAGTHVPATPLAEGLRQHIASLLHASM